MKKEPTKKKQSMGNTMKVCGNKLYRLATARQLEKNKK